MELETLKNIILDQESAIKLKISSQRTIPRDLGIDLKKVFKVPNVLLIKGPRRSGKSFYSHLLLKDKKYRFINFDDERMTLELEELNKIIESFHSLGSFDYIIFDEIHNIKGWERFVSRLRERYNIIVTGSNSRMLSKEFGTHLTGRYLSNILLPFSFSEFLKFKNIKHDKNSFYQTEKKSKIKEAFNQYIKTGGFPESLILGEGYLIELYNAIIIRDVAFSNIRHNVQFRKFANIVINSFSSKFSIKKASDILKLSSPTLENYFNLLENSFLVFKINKFSKKLREQEQSIKKVYCIDNGLANAVTLKFSENKGRLLENLVALRLLNDSLNDNFDIFYYYNYRNECDFLVKKGARISKAVQVTWNLENNKKRELNGLMEAMDEFKLKEGLILTYEQEQELKIKSKRITIKPVWKWLLTKENH